MSLQITSGTQCIDSAKKGIAWLLENQNGDGSWKRLPNPPFDAYYRAAWTLSLMGEGSATNRTLDYVKAQFLTPEGDFLPREGGWYKTVHYPYPNAILIYGAQKADRYDLVQPGLRFLLGQQDPTYGGFYMTLAEPGQRAISNTLSTSMAGVALLAAGQLDAARRAGDWHCRLVEMQPALEERFYTATKPDGSLRTDYANEETRWHMVDSKVEGIQCWYSIGLPFAFAVQLAEATGEKCYADLAQALFDFLLRCVSPWDGPSSGKAAWACSMLYRQTGEQRYRDIALRVAGNFISRQTPEGWFKGWAYAPPKPGEEQFLTVRQFESTLEFCQWLGLIGSNLLARDPE